VLRDRVPAGVRVLFVGINPGARSEAIGHHFAGYSNRFWKLLWESGLVPEPIGTEDDVRLGEWGFGITNLVPRMTPGIGTLRPEEYVAGLRTLRRKVRRWRPEMVAFVGVTIYRAVCGKGVGRGFPRGPGGKPLPTPFPLGLQPGRFEGARVFVLPNPSGRNASVSYGDMLAAYRALADFLATL
jgi:TDG/mug DNA glycosylase family protein